MKQIAALIVIVATAGPVWFARPGAAQDAVPASQVLLSAPAVAAVPLAMPSGKPEGDLPVIDPKLRLPPEYAALRPPARKGGLPRTRWQHMSGNQIWTRAALSALKEHGKPLVDMVPADIENWCPAYPEASASQRGAFWVGFLSALAKHESTYKPWAVGGGGQWYGLLQILPSTARGYQCHVGTGEGLKNGAANLSCAVRILSHTVPRDGVIHGYRNKRGLGVTADWGPMHAQSKRSDMASWLKRQNYCKPRNATRPKARP
ncbi:MAG: transglycosylase SLT domain-containing protein [Sulfitobacter sp.]